MRVWIIFHFKGVRNVLTKLQRTCPAKAIRLQMPHSLPLVFMYSTNTKGKNITWLKQHSIYCMTVERNVAHFWRWLCIWGRGDTQTLMVMCTTTSSSLVQFITMYCVQCKPVGWSSHQLAVHTQFAPKRPQALFSFIAIQGEYKFLTVGDDLIHSHSKQT